MSKQKLQHIKYKPITSSHYHIWLHGRNHSTYVPQMPTGKDFGFYQPHYFIFHDLKQPDWAKKPSNFFLSWIFPSNSTGKLPIFHSTVSRLLLLFFRPGLDLPWLIAYSNSSFSPKTPATDRSKDILHFNIAIFPNFGYMCVFGDFYFPAFPVFYVSASLAFLFWEGSFSRLGKLFRVIFPYNAQWRFLFAAIHLAAKTRLE